MNLSKIRKEKRFSQYEVAKILNISQGSYSNYENGKREPDIETLKKLSVLFNTSVDNLIKDTPTNDTSKNLTYYQQEVLEYIPNLNQIECAKVVAYIEGLKAGKREFQQEKNYNYKGE